jgi:RimJ/RimL family protein N-acetyltransferase
VAGAGAEYLVVVVARREPVVLRPPTRGFAGISEWYTEAAQTAFEERSLEELIAQRSRVRGLRPITIGPDGEPIGLVEYRRDGDWIIVPLIVLAKPYRGWGYGSEAVRVLEDRALRDDIAHRFGAEVDRRNGLGLYFWLRLGYRPAMLAEFDWQRNETRDKMPMVRIPREVRRKR